MTLRETIIENLFLSIGVAALLIHVVIYTISSINLRTLLIFSFITIFFGFYVFVLTKLRARKDEKETKDFFKLKTTLVIPKNFTPLCTVEPFVEIVKKVFKDVCASVATDDIDPCKDSTIVEKRYEYILRDTKEDYKKEGNIYITETAFFVIVYRIDVPDILWIRTVLDTIESIQKETFEYQTRLRKNGFRVVSVTKTHNMRI